MSDREPLRDDRTPLERLVAPPQVYRHYRGAYYSVVCVSRYTETLEWLVTYRLTNRSDQFWTRPLGMFAGVLPDGTPRFERRK